MDTTSSAVRVLNAWRNRDEKAGRTAAPVVTHTRTAALVIEAAESCKLPLPCDVLISSVTVDLHFDTLDDLTAWSKHLGEPIHTERHKLGPFGVMLFHTIEADMFGVDIRFTTSAQPEVSL